MTHYRYFWDDCMGQMTQPTVMALKGIVSKPGQGPIPPCITTNEKVEYSAITGSRLTLDRQWQSLYNRNYCVVSVWMSCHVLYSVDTSKHSQTFLLSGRPTILVFPYKTLWQYSNANPKLGQKLQFSANIWVWNRWLVERWVLTISNQ